MNDVNSEWMGLTLTGARPRAVAALYRYFRDIDLAEEAFQEACLKALKSWPRNGPPRDPAAWLILVGRNTGIDTLRRRAKPVRAGACSACGCETRPGMREAAKVRTRPSGRRRREIRDRIERFRSLLMSSSIKLNDYNWLRRNYNTI